MMKKSLRITKVIFFTCFAFFCITCSSSAGNEQEPEDEGCKEVCKIGFVLNQEKCECEPEPCTISCDEGRVLNTETCECEPEPCTLTCADGEILNEETCQCEKEPCEITCADNEILNEDECECIAFVANKIEVDAADITVVEDWKIKTDIANYTGIGYIVWEGPGQTWKGTVGEVGQLKYTINVPRAGTYLFKWRSYIAKKADVDAWAEHNDTWLKIQADAFFAKKDNSILYPKGTGKSPNPAGENGNGFFKVYMNTLDAWSTTSSTSDNDAHQIYARFDEAKEYTIIIAARSDYHAIDSFTLVEQKPDN